MVNVKSTLFRKSVSWRSISGLCWLSIPNRDRPTDLLGNRIMSVQLIVHQNPDYLAVLWGGKFSQENLDLYFAALYTLTEEARSLPRLHDARHINMDVSAELIRSVCKSQSRTVSSRDAPDQGGGAGGGQTGLWHAQDVLGLLRQSGTRPADIFKNRGCLGMAGSGWLQRSLRWHGAGRPAQPLIPQFAFNLSGWSG